MENIQAFTGLQVIPGNLQNYVSIKRSLLQSKTLPAHFSNDRMVYCCPLLKPLTALSIGNQTAKVKTTMLVSMIIYDNFFSEKNLILKEQDNCFNANRRTLNFLAR